MKFYIINTEETYTDFAEAFSLGIPESQVEHVLPTRYVLNRLQSIRRSPNLIKDDLIGIFMREIESAPLVIGKDRDDDPDDFSGGGSL